MGCDKIILAHIQHAAVVKDDLEQDEEHPDSILHQHGMKTQHTASKLSALQDFKRFKIEAHQVRTMVDCSSGRAN